MPSYAVPSLSRSSGGAVDVLGANAARLAVSGFIVKHQGRVGREIAEGRDPAVGAVGEAASALRAAVFARVLAPSPRPPR